MEAAENRHNSIIAQRIIVSVTSKLMLGYMIILSKDFAEKIRYICGCAIAWAVQKSPPDEHGRCRWHGHFILTERAVDPDGNFADKKFESNFKTRPWTYILRDEFQDMQDAMLRKNWRATRVSFKTPSELEIDSVSEPEIWLSFKFAVKKG